MLVLLLIFLFLASIFATGFWQSSQNAVAFSKSPPGAQERFELSCKKLSLPLISLEFLVLIIAGLFSSLDIWDLIAIVALIPVVAILIKSITTKQPLFSVKLSENKILNYFWIDLPFQYLYFYIWIKSLILLFGEPI